MNECGPFNSKSRKRNKSSERRDLYRMVHREYDNRSVVEVIQTVINMTIAMNYDESTYHIY